WDYFSTGSNVVIAIVDDAVSRNHSDLSPNLWVNPGEIAGNGIDDDGNGFIDDINGYDVADNDANPNPPSLAFDHGTHVAGIASAATNNNNGISSIGYSCKLMCVKASNTPSLITNGYDGIIYAANSGANVINLSWGSSSFSTTAQNIINYARSKGCIIVAAAGNDNVSTLFYPAAYTGVISVAATAPGDTKASFSNYGNWITVSAPGLNIYSTLPGDTYGNLSGTSMASPLVAGLVGLMRSLNPGMPAADLINCLKTTATNIDALNPTYTGQLGTGRIDAEAAMQCVNASLSLPPVADFSASYTTISAGGSVTFSDLSTYSPTNWTWTFAGGTPATYTGQNPPAITYNTAGVYTVSLTVSNTNGSNAKTRTSYITVNPPSSCTTVNFPAPVGWSFFNYYVGGGGVGQNGWINGMNVNLEKQKAMYFDVSATPATYLTRTLIGFGLAYSATPSKVVPINIYDGTSGSPGALLGTATTTMGQIMDDVDNSAYTEIPFYTPVALPASKKFFVSVDLTNLCWSVGCKDTLNILSNANGQTTPTLAWEQLSDNTWHAYSSGGVTYNLDVSLIIHPYVTNQPAIATFTSSLTTICEGNSISLNAAGSTHDDSLSWHIPGASPSDISSDLTPTVFFPNSGVYPVTLYVIGGGCADFDSVLTNITVNPKPTVSVSISKNPICDGETVTLTASGAASYSWSPGTALNAVTGSVVMANPSSSTTYQVQGTQAGCTNSTPIPIDVNPVIPASVTLDASDNNVPPGTELTFTATTATGGTNPVFNFLVNSISVQSGSSATYTTTTLLDGDKVSCNLVSDQSCLTSLTASSAEITVNILGALPVRLDSFKGTNTVDGNLLEWNTDMEINSSYFVVERSKDGTTFSDIGRVNAAGRSMVAEKYNLLDATPFAGISYYRLRMVDINDSYDYSYIIAIKDGRQQNLLSIWPNPAGKATTARLQLTGNVNGKIIIKITDQVGRFVSTQVSSGVGGVCQADISVEKLLSGLYFVACYNEKNERLGIARLVVLH
ncbi:MAG: S8 family serine peptidase, partial [Bacteroidota bacterium]